MATRISDGNSSVNQRIKDKFVRQHVYCDVHLMVEYILSKYDGDAPFTLDDIKNYWYYPEHYGKYANFDGGGQDALDEEIKRLVDLQGEMLETDREHLIDDVQIDIDVLDDLEQEYQEVFEWWVVSDFLCKKLEALGHPVISDHSIWGRCSTGQAIFLDGAITKICSDMDILEGQENSWE